MISCDLLEKSYLCGINNNCLAYKHINRYVVICLKSLTFVVSITTLLKNDWKLLSCDLLEKSYLCGINNNMYLQSEYRRYVVICLKSLTFVVSITTWYVVKHCVLVTYKVVVKINFDPQLKIPFLLNGIFCIVYWL